MQYVLSKDFNTSDAHADFARDAATELRLFFQIAHMILFIVAPLEYARMRDEFDRKLAGGPLTDAIVRFLTDSYGRPRLTDTSAQHTAFRVADSPGHGRHA